jgi:hypothetical protein
MQNGNFESNGFLFVNLIWYYGINDMPNRLVRASEDKFLFLQILRGNCNGNHYIIHGLTSFLKPLNIPSLHVFYLRSKARVKVLYLLEDKNSRSPLLKTDLKIRKMSSTFLLTSLPVNDATTWTDSNQQQFTENKCPCFLWIVVLSSCSARQLPLHASNLCTADSPATGLKRSLLTLLLLVSLFSAHLDFLMWFPDS